MLTIEYKARWSKRSSSLALFTETQTTAESKHMVIDFFVKYESNSIHSHIVAFFAADCDLWP